MNPPDGRRHWTVLIYMAADNNLERYAIQDINELEKVGSTSQVSVVVQIDRTPGYDESNGNWQTTRRYYITADEDSTGISSDLIEDLGELDSADPQTLADFIEWGTTTYPADNYLLVLWDHGRGWQTATTRLMTEQREIKAINVDDTTRTEMTLSDLSACLEQGTRINVVLFDACLMGMLEVAYSIRNAADIMIASEENIPVTGQPYDRILYHLAVSPSISPSELSRRIVDEYMDRYVPSSTATFTLSAIDLHSLESIVDAAHHLAQQVIANPDAWDVVRSAQAQAQRYDFDRNYYIAYKDLADFARLVYDLASNPGIRSAAGAVTEAVDSTVIYQRNSGGKVAESHGVSVYIPAPDSMSVQYPLLNFARDTSWDEMLAAY